MPRYGPISRRDLIYSLRKRGFFGPYPGTDHPIMIRGNVTIKIPNPHRGDIGTNLLAKILRQAGVTRQQWEQL